MVDSANGRNTSDGKTGIPRRWSPRSRLFGQAARPFHDLPGVCRLCPHTQRREPLPDRGSAWHLWVDPGDFADSVRPVVRPGRPQGHDRARARPVRTWQRRRGTLVLDRRGDRRTGAAGGRCCRLGHPGAGRRSDQRRKPHQGDGAGRNYHRHVVHDCDRARSGRRAFRRRARHLLADGCFGACGHRDHGTGRANSAPGCGSIATPKPCRL